MEFNQSNIFFNQYHCPYADCGLIIYDMKKAITHCNVYHHNKRIPCKEKTCRLFFTSKGGMINHYINVHFEIKPKINNITLESSRKFIDDLFLNN